MVRHWIRLSRETMDVPSLEVFIGWDFGQNDLVEGASAMTGGLESHHF